MRRINFFLTVGVMFALAASLTGSASAAPPGEAKWTIMVYMSGDNDLENYVVPDIETELAPTGSSVEVQVVALVDRIPGFDTSYDDWQTTKLFHVTQGMTAAPENAVADWGERNMGDPQTLIEFVTWAKASYPADHYALYFWGHGSNWHPGHVMRDDTNADTLEYHEMKAALPAIGFIDMVGYDGCNMAAIEVQLLWHGHASALTHSQEWVGAEGIQYDLVLPQLAADPDMSADELAVASSQSATSDKTWSAVVVDSRFETLLRAVDEWSIALLDGLPQYRINYKQAFTATRSFWRAPADKDLYDMAYEIHRLVNDQDIKDRSQDVMDAVEAVVLHERHVKTYADVHGITIYQKVSHRDMDYAYYLTLDFARQTSWDDFLDAYAR